MSWNHNSGVSADDSVRSEPEDGKATERMAWNYRTEFVFEAYVNHLSNLIFLKGLPDSPLWCVSS